MADPTDAFATAYRRMLGVGHRTVWFEGNGVQDGEPLPVLMFFSIAPEAVKKARAALEAAGVLCDMDLGSI